MSRSRPTVTLLCPGADRLPVRGLASCVRNCGSDLVATSRSGRARLRLGSDRASRVTPLDLHSTAHSRDRETLPPCVRQHPPTAGAVSMPARKLQRSTMANLITEPRGRGRPPARSLVEKVVNPRTTQAVRAPRLGPRLRSARRPVARGPAGGPTRGGTPRFGRRRSTRSPVRPVVRLADQRAEEAPNSGPADPTRSSRWSGWRTNQLGKPDSEPADPSRSSVGPAGGPRCADSRLSRPGPPPGPSPWSAAPRGADPSTSTPRRSATQPPRGGPPRPGAAGRRSR